VGTVAEGEEAMSACPACLSWDSRVLSTRKSASTVWYIRRRECIHCNHRWTTYEVPADDVQQAEHESQTET
jgi:transcriptional regulator NrdR family protein